MKKVCLIGASGGIGKGFLNHLLNANHRVYAFSRRSLSSSHKNCIFGQIDLANEDAIKNAAQSIPEKLDMIIVATGFLHDKNQMPEKNMRDISIRHFEKSFALNTIGPALIGKYFLPLLKTHEKSIMAFLSARVGSISDNQMGGWYAYRSSKAALNMIIKNFAIEMGRRYKNMIIVGLQPGTVDTNLSKPFQGNVSSDHLFSADYSAGQLLSVLENLTPRNSGHLLDWRGETIPF